MRTGKTIVADQKKILVIDDEVDFLKALGGYLKREGYAVSTCSSCRRGLNRAKKEPYDLILVDIKMPGMDGIDAIKQIERVRRKAQFIIITGYAITEDVVSLIKQDKRVHGYLLKPFNLNELMSRTKDILEERK